jgi:hypothetical protein
MNMEQHVQTQAQRGRRWRSAGACLAVVLLGAMALAARQAGADKAADQGADAKGDPRQAKLAAARGLYEVQVKARAAGLSGLDEWGMTDQYTWSRRWMEAQRDLAADPAGRRAAVAAHLDRMRPTLKSLEAMFKSGSAQFRDVLAARYYVAEAEQWLADADSH